MKTEMLLNEIINKITKLEERVTILEAKTNSELPKSEIAPSKKYRKISEKLINSNEDKVVLSFDEINHLLGFELPKSARKHRAFWANTETHSIAHSWLSVGYKTVFVDMEKQDVIFEKDINYKLIK